MPSLVACVHHGRLKEAPAKCSEAVRHKQNGKNLEVSIFNRLHMHSNSSATMENPTSTISRPWHGAHIKPVAGGRNPPPPQPPHPRRVPHPPRPRRARRTERPLTNHSASTSTSSMAMNGAPTRNVEQHTTHARQRSGVMATEKHPQVRDHNAAIDAIGIRPWLQHRGDRMEPKDGTQMA